MGKFPVTYNSFEGGWSGDIKIGSPGSFWYSRAIDFRKAPSQMSILPGAVKESGLVVTGLITDMIQLPSGAYVAIDSSGGVYQRTAGGAWSKNGTVLSSTAYGMVYNLQHDTIYVPGLNTLHSITNADGRFGGVFTVNESAISQIQDKSSANGHAQSYTVLAAISESTADRLPFTPNIEPLYSIKLWVATVGTGSIVLTIHDAANNTLGTVTKTAAQLNAGAFNEFVFSTPARMYAKPNPATYHLHLTFSGGTTATFGTSTTNDFSTGDYQTFGNRFVSPASGFHPVLEYLQYILIGNERYLAVWEPISQSAPSTTELNQHRLTFPSGYSVTSLAPFNEFTAIACEKRSTSPTNEFQEGKIFLWDGTAVTYNSIIDVPEGSPYSMFSHKNTLFWFANGAWWASTGGMPVKIFQMPGTDFEFTNTNTYMVNYPHTMTVRNGILLGGFPSETNSVVIEHGVYSFGRRNKNYPDSFGFSYVMSTASLVNTGSNNLRIGMVKNFGDKLFIAWRDDSQPVGSRFGVDKVDPNSPPAATATWESLITDLQFISVKRRFPRPDNDKQATYLTVVFKTALPAGTTVTPKIKINRESSWELSPNIAQAGDTSVVFNIIKRYKETQVGMDLTCTGTTPPEVVSLILVTDSLPAEAD